MRKPSPGLTLAVFAALLLTACGGGGGSGNSSSGGGTPNMAPIANAGPNQTVNAFVTVTLNGTASSDADGSIASYAWAQTSGTTVTLSNTTASQPTFVAPNVVAASNLTFMLVVTDNRGANSAIASVVVTVNPVANATPTANAGPDQSATSGVTVTLNGSGSSDSDGTIAGFVWTQTGGTPTVTLSSSNAALPTFVAPTVAAAATLTFSLTVTDNRGASSASDTVSITVNPLVAGNVTVTGRVTFGRVPFSGSPPFGLNYRDPSQWPSRGVKVEALAAGTVRDTVFTTDLGNYSVTVDSNTNITIRVTAQIQRTGSPQWDVRVQDGINGTPYTYTEAASFNSGSGTTHDVAIPTGINLDGIATGQRASGPFAILDTIYRGMQTVLGAAPATNFPALIVDWGTQANGTFFSGGGTQHIALLADLTEDTDEFDQHVIAHEFGHYIEYNFSRADNIGGAHGVGDKLDPRVAFGEGFGYAFAGIVMGNPVARDSYFDGTTQRSGFFDIENNPQTNPVGAPNNDFGCWCSESSVWSILWDLYDDSVDANDTVSLGFTPIWTVLVNEQDVTPAFTTIFSFITALKARNAGIVDAINTLVNAQNINSDSIDIYGSTETFFPPVLISGQTHPLYTLATVGGPAVTMQTTDNAGRHNKLGARRFVRFNVPSQRSVTITASSSNTNSPDTDFSVWRAGSFVLSATAPPAPNETATFNAPAGDYVIDVYDCANGCDSPEGTPGEYTLTVTIN